MLSPTWIDGRFPPEFYLFFSVDIEGSTIFKNSVTGGRSTWGPFFLEFFQSFPANLSKCEADFEGHFALDKGSPFVLWKSLGDELIFAKKLNNGFDSFVAVCAAKEAIINGSEQLRTHRESRGNAGEKDHYPTHLKGTIWLAGFPIKNMKVPRDGLQDDYIGPSIDLGFRLTKLSSPWHMAVSTSLAWMVAKIQNEHSSKLKGINIKWVYRGREALKGILSGKAGYPVFCIDVAASADGVGKEELNLLDRAEIKPRDVIDFCTTLYSSDGCRPFILGDKSFDFDIGSSGDCAYDTYKDSYVSFLSTQPVISEPSSLAGSSDTQPVMDAIKQAASAASAQ